MYKIESGIPKVTLNDTVEIVSYIQEEDNDVGHSELNQEVLEHQTKPGMYSASELTVKTPTEHTKPLSLVKDEKKSPKGDDPPSNEDKQSSNEDKQLSILEKSPSLTVNKVVKKKTSLI